MNRQPKPVLIDVTRLILRVLKGKRATGVDRVGLTYVAHYQSQSRAVLSWQGRVLVLPSAQSQRVFASLLLENQGDPQHKQIYQNKHWLLLLARLGGVWRADTRYAGCFLFNTGHKGLESDQYAATLAKMQVRPIYFIHDLIPLTHPEYCRPDEDDKHYDRMARAVHDCTGLIVNSEFTKNELQHFAQRHHFPLPPIQTAWLASGIKPFKEQALPEKSYRSDTYFVMLSTIEARKNHLLILHVWRHLVERYGADAPKLILIGQRGWECEQVVDLLERAEVLKSAVVEINHCSDERLAHILRDACALLFPSFVEGFGMPLVEALAAGVPVIASDIPVFTEIAQGIPELLDPIDGMGWLRCIEQYRQADSPQRAAQMQRLQTYQHWTWPQHFAQVDEFLQQLEV